MLKKLQEKYWLKNLIMILVGNLLVAFSVSFFILPGNILSGGTATSLQQFLLYFRAFS